MAKTAETCSVVADQGCHSPANVERRVHVRTTCFACGLAVCINPACSHIRIWFDYGRKRICASCDGDDLRQRYPEPDR